MGYFLVDYLEQPLCNAKWHIFDEAEATGKWADRIGGVDCERPFEDIKSQGTGVCKHHPWHISSVNVNDHVWQHLILQPREDTILAWVRSSVRPVIPRGAPVSLVKLQGLASCSNHGRDIVAVLGREGSIVEFGVLVKGKEIVVDVAAGEGW